MPKLCRARLTLPSADGQHTIIFECNAGAGHAAAIEGSLHLERGRVRGTDGKIRKYELYFSEPVDTQEVWRDAKAAQAVTQITSIVQTGVSEADDD